VAVRRWEKNLTDSIENELEDGVAKDVRIPNSPELFSRGGAIANRDNQPLVDELITSRKVGQFDWSRTNHDSTSSALRAK
jgi:hypothetical protein